MSRIKALYRSWAIPCSGTSVYAPRHRAEWLGKIPEAVFSPATKGQQHDLRVRSVTVMNVEKVSQFGVIIQPSVKNGHIAKGVNCWKVFKSRSFMRVIGLESHAHVSVDLYKQSVASKAVRGDRELPEFLFRNIAIYFGECPLSSL
jgi:hypothetical protein